jgi:hypothetical protein
MKVSVMWFRKLFVTTSAKLIQYRSVCGYFGNSLNSRQSKKLKLSYFTSIKNTLRILQLCHFPVLLLVNSKNAVYDHVVVIWQGRIIDYESENIYMLTHESLQQICGTNTYFSHVSCGYGLFLPAKIQTLSPDITNWGKDDYDDNKLTIRKFFDKK